MNLLTSDRILKNIVDLCRWIFESLFVVFWLSMVSKPWSHGCHLGITLKDFLNPFACEGHNSFVENLLSTGAQRYILITHLITEIAFSLWAYRLPNSNAKTRPEGSRICLLFCCIFGQCRVLYRKKFLDFFFTSLIYQEYQSICFHEYYCWNFRMSSRLCMIILCFRVRFYGMGASGTLSPTDLYINGVRGIPIPNHIVLRWSVPAGFAPNQFPAHQIY